MPISGRCFTSAGLPGRNDRLACRSIDFGHHRENGRCQNGTQDDKRGQDGGARPCSASECPRSSEDRAPVSSLVPGDLVAGLKSRGNNGVTVTYDNTDAAPSDPRGDPGDAQGSQVNQPVPHALWGPSRSATEPTPRPSPGVQRRGGNHVHRCQQSAGVLQVRQPPARILFGISAIEFMERKLRTTKGEKPFNGDAGQTSSVCPCLRSRTRVIWTKRKKKTGQL